MSRARGAERDKSCEATGAEGRTPARVCADAGLVGNLRPGRPPATSFQWLGATQVIPGYTRAMKTAISVPDDIYDRAERAARRHGMNRSQFYAEAAARYVADLESADLTDAIDSVAEAANTDTSAGFAVAASSQLLDGTDAEW